MDSTQDNFKSESESYCPHYERDTCLIHFKCCPKKDWYPCHKCHNAAVGLNPNDKEREINKPPERAAFNNTVRDSDTTEERSSIEAEVGSKLEGAQVQEHESTSDGMEETENPFAEAASVDRESPEQEETDNDGLADVKTGEEMDSKNPKDPLLASPAATETMHLEATALDGTQLKCTECGHEQMFSQTCESCNKSFASYFCGKCKLLIEKNVDAYHCDDCGICRGNKADHFHCHVCNICMSQSLKEKHKCFADRGHDPCAICYEEVFSGAIIFPCFHMVHRNCAEKLVLSGSRTCPMCRSEIFQSGAEQKVIVEDTIQQNPSNPGFIRSCLAKIWKKFVPARSTSSEGAFEPIHMTPV